MISSPVALLFIPIAIILMQLGKVSNNEIGRKMKAREIEPGTVVVLHKPGRPHIAMWVAVVGEVFIAFTNMAVTLLLKRHADGSLCDSSNMRVSVHEYRGEV